MIPGDFFIPCLFYRNCEVHFFLQFTSHATDMNGMENINPGMVSIRGQSESCSFFHAVMCAVLDEHNVYKRLLH